MLEALCIQVVLSFGDSVCLWLCACSLWLASQLDLFFLCLCQMHYRQTCQTEPLYILKEVDVGEG